MGSYWGYASEKKDPIKFSEMQERGWIVWRKAELEKVFCGSEVSSLLGVAVKEVY